MRKDLINDKLIVMELENIKELNPANKNEVVRTILDKQEEIKSVFSNNEYIKMDLTLGEIIGLKSTATIGSIEVGDLPALDYILRNDPKYRKSNIINLGNVDMLYDKVNESAEQNT